MSEEVTIEMLLKSAMCEIEQAIQQARNEALEEAAKVCEKMYYGVDYDDDINPNVAYEDGGKDCAQAIRDLQEKE